MTLTSTGRTLSRLVNRKPSFLALCLLALGLMLASPFTPTASAQVVATALQFTVDPTLAQETSGNGNGIIEPGESGKIGIRAKNVTGFVVHSSSIYINSFDVSITSYPAWALWEGYGEEILEVQFDVPPLGCGGYYAEFDITVNWYIFYGGSGYDFGFGGFEIGVSTQGNTTNFTYTDTPVAIPDSSASGVDIPLEVSGVGTIKDLDFIINGTSCNGATGPPGVGLDHANVHDLVLKLTSPQGTTVTLMDRPGDATNAGSNFCNTVLDDNQYNPPIQSITTDGAPYSGTFAPANPLSAFIGENPNGTWTLNVSDQADDNAGQLNAFSLAIKDSSSDCDNRTQRISGRVTTNGTDGLSGVTMKLRNNDIGLYASGTTDANGNYAFEGVPARYYSTVIPYKLGYIFNPMQRGFSVLDTEATADFRATRTNFSIKGKVVEASGAVGLGGVKMNLTGDRVASVTTDADGNYTFANLPASGNYMIAPSIIGYRFTPATHSYYQLGTNQTSQNFVARVQNYTVGGIVKLGTARLAGVTITLSSPVPAGFTTRTAITNSNGAYLFTGLPSGRNYKVTPTKAGYQFLPVNQSLTNLSANQAAVNFAVKVYSITGRITRTGTSTGISAVTVTLTSPTPAGFAPRTVQTTSTGVYSFTTVPAGRNYTIKPVKSGFTFSPATHTITNLSGNIPAGSLTNFTGAGP